MPDAGFPAERIDRLVVVLMFELRWSRFELDCSKSGPCRGTLAFPDIPEHTKPEEA